MRAPVRWVEKPDEVPVWELGWAWGLFNANYPEELRKVESLWPWLEEEKSDPNRCRLLEDAVEAARAVLPPPPEHWNYPRLVLAEPPAGRFFDAAGYPVFWEARYRPVKPLTGFRRIAEAVKEDMGSQLAKVFPRTRETVERMAPRVGILDPFRQDRRYTQETEADLLPHLRVGKASEYGEMYLGRQLGEDLCSWVTASLVLRFWDLAAEAAGKREELKRFLERIPNEFGLDPELWQRALEHRNEYNLSLDPISVLLREAVHLRLYGVHPKSMKLSPPHIAERLREWGILGVVTPGPLRMRTVPKRGAEAGEPLTGLASSFHLALLDLAALLREGQVLVCEWCGRSFKAQRPRRSRYCTDRCRISAYRHGKKPSWPRSTRT